MIDPRIRDYEVRYFCQLLGFLGAGRGQDGFVQYSNQWNAVKFFDSVDRFHRELEVYRVLQQRETHLIAGHNIPQFIRCDEKLRTIEMTIVNRPFVLDFAGAKLPEEVPDFEQHTLDEHNEHLLELFGDRLADALFVAEMFQRETGFILLDIHPGNIAFAE